MVAVVAGNSLGLNTSSARTLGSGGYLGVAGNGRGGDSIYVNAATGNLVIQRADDFMLMPGATDFALTNTYNSLGLVANSFDNPDTWQLSGSKKIRLVGTLNTAGSQIIRTNGDGSEQTYNFVSADLYVSTDGDGAHDTVTRNTSTSQWTWMSDTGEISETYYSLSSSTAGQPAGWIFEARDLNGQLLAYTYNTSNRLTAINNVATGESLTFVYSGANVTQVNASVKKVDLVTGAVTTVTVTRVRYGYDASNRLQTITTDLSPDDGVITDNNTYVTTFAYNPNGLVSSITEKDGSSVTFNYVSVNSAWRVQQVIVTNGTETRTTTFAYNTSTRITKITDPVGLATDLEYDTSNRLIRVRSPDSDGVIQEMLYGYDASGNVTSITDPKGNVTTLQYDSRGNLTLQRDAAGNTVTRIFNTGATTESAKNLLLSETVYLTPDPDGAGAGTASNPLVTRYIYDSANNLRYVVTNEGRVTEYLQEGANVTDPTANSGRKRVAKLEYTVTRYAVPASATATLLLSDLTTWRKAAGTNRSAVLRTDYTYDTAERLQKATDYANADTSGNGIVDGKESVTQFVYDAFGRLLKTVDGVGNTTLRTYDGLGRMLTNTLRASGQSSGGTVTTMSYDDVGNRTLVTLANGLITTSLYNKAGDLISVTNTGPGSVNLGVTQYFYDLDGRLRMVQDPTGQRQHTFWNAEGQKIAEVDGDGTLTEYVYDNDNRVVKSIRYATLVNTSTLVDGTGQPVNVALATLRTAANTQPTLNQINRVIYDTAGRVVYTVDGDGAVVNLRYDGASRLTDSYAYADKVTISSSTGEMTAAQVVTALTTANASYASSVDNRVSRSFHDMDGRLIGTLDAEGYFVEFTYDGAGKLTQKIAYAVRQTNATLLATGTFAQLKPASVTETTDLRTNYFYDGQGQLIGQFAASTYDTTLSQIQGYFTEIQYYRNGNVSNRIEYATRIVFTTSSTFATLKTAAAGTAHTTAYLYDEFNRVKQVTNFEGTVGLTVYDSVGNVTSSTAASGTTDVLTTQATYDALGRVLQELTPEGSAAILAGTPVATAWAQYAVTYTYDLAGRRISATDQKGNKTLYFYDADGRERYSVNALGEVVESRYNALNQLSSRIACTTTISTTSLTGGTDLSVVSARVVSTPTTDAVTTFAYTLSGRLQSSITAEGATITHVYSAFGQETSTSELIQGSTSLQTTYKYDRRGLLLETHADPTGINRWTINTYDAFGRVTQSTDPNGNNSLYSYDRFGRVILVTDRLTQTAATTYDAFSRVLSVRDRANNTTSYAYNDSTRTVTITTPELVMVATVHNRNGQTLTVTDGRGNVTTYEYDANGQVKRIYDSLGNLEQRTYERTGMRYDTTDANGVVTRLTYNAANRVLTRVVDVTGLALTTTYGYDGQGRVTSVTDERGVVTQTSYDRDGRVTTIAIDPAALNLRTTFQYDKRGSVTVRTEGYLSSNPTTCTYQYDSLGRRIQETTTLGLSQPDAVTQYKYDKNGNLTRKIDARGFSTWYVYDAEDRFRYTVDALGGLTANTYDVEGRLQSTQRYATAISVATFGDIVTFGQVTAPTANAADRREQHVYDKDGREVFTIDSGYGVTKRFYDGNGNVIRALRYATPIASGTYTTVASVAPTTNAQDRDLRTVYDVRNRACFTIDTLGGVTQIKYDAAGNVTSSTQYATINTATIPATPVLGDMTTWVTANAGASDRTTRYWYDSANRVRFTLVVDSTLANDTQGWLTELRYNDATRQETDVVYAAKATIASGAALSAVVTAAAGIASASTDQSTLKTFDKGGRLITLTDALGISESYGYDAVGNRTSFTNKKGNVWTYVYDANHRLVQETSPVVDITTVTESVPGAGVLQSSTANAGIITKITYDAVGNVLTRTEAFGRAEQRVTSYSYDALGRQVTTTFPNLKVYSAPANDELNAGTAVTRQEVTATISSTVTYNALGDAVVGLDVDGRYSHKAYDTLGRLKYEVDALNYVTEYVYDSFGNRLQTKRYAAALNTTGLTASAIWTSANILAGITSGSGDRVITSEYDNLNRATRVLQPAAFNFDSNVGSAGGTTNTSSAETKYEYNAFGDVTRQRQLFNASTVQYADTWFYYDRRGLKTAQVDPLKYLMIFEYDETGDLKRQVEYAKAVTGTVNASSYGTVTTTTPQNSPSDAAGYDRETLFAYDRLNRKTSQTLVNVEYTTISGTTTTSATGNQVTTFGYDAVGNQTSVTDPAGSVTYTYYDVLGRVVAIAEPVRDVDGSATTTNLIPLTLMKRDAYGNLVEQVRYANGATVAAAPTTATPLNFTAGAVNASDRTTRLLLDNYGHALRTQDAAGASRYASYNKRGDVAKEWQYTTNADGATETLVTIHQYDALGRELAVVEPQKLGGTNVVVTTAVQYNAFGEVIRKGVNGGQQEYFDYDTAGRVWRTNSGDGVNKVYLYNLNGQVTAICRRMSRVPAQPMRCPPLTRCALKQHMTCAAVRSSRGCRRSRSRAVLIRSPRRSRSAT
jgi:YD repeat-containing protein